LRKQGRGFKWVNLALTRTPGRSNYRLRNRRNYLADAGGVNNFHVNAHTRLRRDLGLKKDYLLRTFGNHHAARYGHLKVCPKFFFKGLPKRNRLPLK
jgi:hypothetical protein